VVPQHWLDTLLWLLRPVIVHIPELNETIVPELNETIVFSLARGRIEKASESEQPDVVINSQPLWFGFKLPFGIQTLGVSARLRLVWNCRNWKVHRILLSLNNAGIYLRPK
jgi:UDP-MurNAc hydroxylase